MTADKSHKQFAFEFLHECLWNGPVWPYATSQTLTGMIRALQDDKLKNLPITAREYCLLLKIYATSQYIAIDNNEKRPWIDENLDGETGEWLARKWLYERDRQDKDRGKDYNHSTFIDLVIGGLCGAKGYNGVATFTPINDTTEISYFSLKGISICGELPMIAGKFWKNSSATCGASIKKQSKSKGFNTFVTNCAVFCNNNRILSSLQETITSFHQIFRKYKSEWLFLPLAFVFFLRRLPLLCSSVVKMGSDVEKMAGVISRHTVVY